MEYLAGIDDTDSTEGMCTTYLAYYIISKARNFRVKPFPRLVRLNPNIPFKTRGNASVCLNVVTDDPDKTFDEICGYVEELSDTSHGANTGLVFVSKERVSHEFGEIYSRALRGVVNHRKIRKFLERKNIQHFTTGNGMGLVGASAAVGLCSEDNTYELIAYRKRENWGKPRLVEANSVVEMDLSTFPFTFNNFDYEKGRVLITPHGPDPVLFGIRGETPGILLKAFKMVKVKEPIDGYVIYISNQHTDAHLKCKIERKSFSSGWIDGTVKNIKKIAGGHIIIELDGISFPAAVYSPTGDLLRVAAFLMEGDKLRLYGGMRKPSKNHPMVLNVEKIQVLALKDKIYSNPFCPKCLRRMKSEGTGKGFECRRCGLKRKRKTLIKIERKLVPGIYLPSPRAHRHLTKPYARYINVGVFQQHEAGGAWFYKDQGQERLQMTYQV